MSVGAFVAAAARPVLPDRDSVYRGYFSHDGDMPFTTFPDLLRRAAHRTPEATFLRWSDRGKTLTFAQTEEQTDRAAAAFWDMGVRQGDRVGILAHNGLDYVVAMWGAWKIGAISAHISVLVVDELAEYVQACTPKVLVYTHDALPAITRDRAAMPSITQYLCMDGPQEGALAWGDALAGAPSAVPVVNVDDMMPAHLSFTSGSTGKPKGAVLNHGYTSRASACIAERLGLSSADSSLGATGLASSYGLVVNLLPGVHRQMTVGLRKAWDVVAVWDDLEDNLCTYFPANPPFLTDLLVESRQRGRAPQALRLVASGGAPVAPELKRAYFDELNVAFCESYGQSELGGFVALGRPSRPTEDRLGAVGEPLPDKEVRILDDGDHEVVVNQPGEICVRGGYMHSYWNDPMKTAEATRNGWLHTGDVGRMDELGFVTTLGRVSERIESSDGPIYPRPIEEALQRHPAVRYAAVIPMGNEPAAIVTLWADALSAGTAPDVLALREFYDAQPDADARLARIELLTVMPMTPTGKLDKITLRKQYVS